MSAAADLARERYLSLGTFRRDGTEVRTPVWIVALGHRLYVVTGGDSGKVKRLRHSSRARVAPCDARGRVSGAWHEATARVAEGVAEPALRAAFVAKYGWQVRLLNLVSRLTGRYRRRAWLEITVHNGPGDPSK
jgi:PPOX class probable F420-dependent enzyme